VRFQRWQLAVAAVLVVIIAWALWPSRYRNVQNVDSHGANVIAFGDSLTAGFGAQPGEDYPSNLAARLGVSVINAGVSGDTTESALARLDTDVLARDPRVVIIGLGGNDFLRGVPIATTEANLRTIIERIHAAHAMTVVLGFRFPTLGPSYESMYARVASDEHALLVPDLLDGILGNPSLKSDEIHPNAKGYALIAERVAPPCRALLRYADKRRR
jgi:lysophospholipase L1-like esterase